jgi:hypothetical protein
MAQEKIGTATGTKFQGTDNNQAVHKPSPADNDKNQAMPYMDSYEPGQKLPKAPFGGNLVRPEDRVARVKASAPKEETQSMPSGDIRTPDKSSVGPSIFDKES